MIPHVLCKASWASWHGDLDELPIYGQLGSGSNMHSNVPVPLQGL